ncbi:MAG: SDR family NAD(P)-dependent oxidoreductase [Hyphomonas sp.]
MRPVLWRESHAVAAFKLRPGASVEVTHAEPGIANAIAESLSAHGFDARLVAQPSGAADAAILTEGLSAQPAELRHWSALQASKAVRRDRGVVLLLQGAETNSGLDGLSRTLRKEWPETQAFAWTVPAGAASLVADALNQGYSDGELLSSGALLTAEPGGSLVPPSSLPGASPSVWLVTGGARGVTAACAIELARTAGGTILLAGRSSETPWPADMPAAGDLKTLRGLLVNRSRQTGERITPADIDRTARSLLAGAEIRETLAAIRAAGAEAAYIPLDAGDAAAVAAGLQDAQQRYGLITGWVHGAGVLADRLAMDKTEAELRRVFSPKVGGLMNILAAIDVHQLRHVAFFSSAAAFFGNKGQSDYAMANALLASAGRSLARSNPDARIKVFHWGPWAGGMVDSTLAGHFEAQGIPLIPIDVGARIFVCELLGGAREHVELVVGESWATS